MQGDTDRDDQWREAATAIDGSIVLAGYAYGTWTGPQDSREDGIGKFAAMATDEEGLQLWSYHVSVLGMLCYGIRGGLTK